MASAELPCWVAKSVTITSMDALDKCDANKIGVKRKYVFHVTRLLTLAVLGAVALAIAHEMKIERWSALGPATYPIMIMFWQRSTSFATLICRQLGLSLAGKTTEKLERVKFENVISPSVQELFRVERSCKSLLPMCLTLLCCICIGPPLFSLPHTFEHFGHTLFHVLLFSFLASTAILSWLNIRKPLVKMSSGGIEYCDPFGVTSKYVAWRRLGSCDVVSERNVFGEIVRQSLVFRDTRGKKIGTIWMESNSKGTAVEHTEQITNLVKQGLTVAR